MVREKYNDEIESYKQYYVKAVRRKFE